jgi:hypothetical protein
MGVRGYQWRSRHWCGRLPTAAVQQSIYNSAAVMSSRRNFNLIALIFLKRIVTRLFEPKTKSGIELRHFAEEFHQGALVLLAGIDKFSQGITLVSS